MTKKQRHRLGRILLTAAITVGLLFLPVEGWRKLVLYLIPYGIIGGDVLRKAVKGIRRGRVLDENFLMAVATVGALLLGWWQDGDYGEAIAVMLFYQVGEFFQSYAVGKSRQNIARLMNIRPDTATVEREGKWVSVDPREVAVGQVIRVTPGERVPIDGVVIDGISTLNTAALTGESLPREVGVGEEIVSGCVNMTGVLTIRTTKAFGESTATKILELVENATSRKSRSEEFIRRFARLYTPLVCGVALLLGVVPPLLGGLFGFFAPWEVWIYRALSFLVASCPCALVVSIPLTFFAGIGGAGRQGILIKGSNYLEALAKTGCVVFDKTGTLTRGEFEVVALHPCGIAPDRLLELAALAEFASSHPIAQSLVRAYGREPALSRVTAIREVSGKGVTATVDGQSVAVGNHKLMAEESIACGHPSTPGTVVHLAVEGVYRGYLLIADTPKPTAKEAVATLKQSGIDHTVMLTGDTAPVAEQIAAELAIDTVYSELLPADKVERVEELLAEKPRRTTLAFVGDGINDAPVLARADVGVAMGGMGSDAAIEAADVVLMDDDPRKLVKGIRIAQKCMGIVTQNIAFAIGIKVLALVLVAMGLAGMWLAVFADVGVTVLAILNAMRALLVGKA